MPKLEQKVIHYITFSEDETLPIPHHTGHFRKHNGRWEFYNWRYEWQAVHPYQLSADYLEKVLAEELKKSSNTPPITAL